MNLYESQRKSTVMSEQSEIITIPTTSSVQEHSFDYTNRLSSAHEPVVLTRRSALELACALAARTVTQAALVRELIMCLAVCTDCVRAQHRPLYCAVCSYNSFAGATGVCVWRYGNRAVSAPVYPHSSTLTGTRR